VSEKAAELKGLFELLEEGLDTPPVFVEVDDGAGRPRKIFAHNGHLDFLAVAFDDGANITKSLGVVVALFFVDEYDLIVAQYVSLWCFDVAFNATGLHVVLGTRDPEYAACIQVKQVQKVHISLIKQCYFA